MKKTALIAIFSPLILILTTVNGLLAASFTDNGDGTVTDHITSLVWQQEDDNSKYTWANALTYCENLSLAGKSDWRLPNVRELESLVDDSAHTPAINETYFPNTNLLNYWSSTTYEISTARAWGVASGSGNLGDFGKGNDNYVRCVRSGP